MQRLGGQFLAAARFTLDQHREGRVRVLPQLGPQFLHRRALSHQFDSDDRLGFVGEQIVQGLAQFFRIGWLGDKVGRAQGTGMAGVGFVV